MFRRFDPSSSMLSLAAALALAAAHSDTESVATLELTPAGVRVTLSLDASRVMEICQAKPPGGDDWSDADAAAIADKAQAYVASHWRLTAGGCDIALVPEGIALRAVVDPSIGVARNVRFELTYRAPPLRDVVAELVETLMEGLEPSHRHFVVLKGGDGATLGEFAVVSGLPCRFFIADLGEGATLRRLRAQAVAGARAAVSEPWLAALLLALLVAPLPSRERFVSFAAALAAAAISFTATRAHWISPAPWAARAAAAFAVGYVAIENWRSDPVRLRRATAALFGLVEGMALAPLALMPGRATGAGEGATFIGVALAVAAIVALAIAMAFRVDDWSKERERPAMRVKAAHLALLLVGAAGVALAISARVRGG
jgi:hypothetical protein